ncbi:endothelial cell-specific chemotaxis regulator isoform X4 [Rhineura floridana]|uniref:endothelial cell-specific chemotaxis regulator isoform X4 n=1 Tax=Rhineura floridana TaxID=261503 RepID=UPI002AC85D74|nr:endothelial cell-specific chemotaxis regulator isoform X4 [Rhineura floridana]
MPMFQSLASAVKIFSDSRAAKDVFLPETPKELLPVGVDGAMLDESVFYSVPNKNGNITHPSSAASTGISKWVTPPTKGLLDVKTEFLTVPSPTEEKSAALTVAASGKQKPHHPMVSYSCSDAEAAVGKKNVMLVSMKDLNISNSQGAAKVTIAHEE